jgi:hypothetical protein
MSAMRRHRSRRQSELTLSVISVGATAELREPSSEGVAGWWNVRTWIMSNSKIKNCHAEVTRQGSALLWPLYRVIASVMMSDHGNTTMTDKAEKRTKAIQRAAEFRERAARFESLAAEAQQRGDMQMYIEFERKAAEELAEASSIEADIGKE